MEEGLAFDRLLEGLAADGAVGLALPGVDDPISAPEYVGQVLGLARERGWDFDKAWSAAINRLQLPGDVEPAPQMSALVFEERALLEDLRPYWRSAYEYRTPTVRERATCALAGHRRLSGAQPFRGQILTDPNPA